MDLVPVIDADWIRYAAGFASEKRTILAVHKQTGDELNFKNRTEFYGRGKAKNKGWIGQQLLEGKDVSADEYDILDVQTPEPIDHVLFTVKRMYEGVLNHFGTRENIAYFGLKPSMRVERSTIIEYKGNRTNSLKPIAIDQITEYMLNKYKMIEATGGLEADDLCIIAAQDPKRCVVTHDKDARGCAVNVWNPTKPDEPIIDCRGFGGLELRLKEAAGGRVEKEVKGYGRKFFYFQVGYGDDVDNYRANSATEKEWGELSAYAALEDAKNDKQAIQALVQIYKNLYPEPIEIIGWRGDRILIDWRYVMQENWDMAHMHRHENGDWVNIDNVFDKLGIKT